MRAILKSIKFLTILLFYVLTFLATRPEVELALPALEGETLTTGPPGEILKSHS